jgi:hypothetical protein
MAQTFTSLLVHIVFSTKGRADLIPAALEPKLYAYLGGITDNLGAVCWPPAVRQTMSIYSSRIPRRSPLPITWRT